MKLAHKKYICMLLAFLTAIMMGGFSLASSSASGVDDAKGEIDRLEQEKKDTEKRLKELGYFTTDITGTYGTMTIRAVKAFEARYGKEQTGIATVALQKEL